MWYIVYTIQYMQTHKQFLKSFGSLLSWFEFWYWDQSFMKYMANECSDLVSTQVKQI